VKSVARFFEDKIRGESYFVLGAIMDEIKTYTLEDAHKYFAQSVNGRVWELLQKHARTQDENDEMLYAVHACTYHWKFAGSAVNQQRGEWLISHVHVALGHANEALRHAERCFELTQTHKELMQDFDIAYAFEGVARAQALVGDERIAREFFGLAKQAGMAIADEEDRTIFIGDYDGGDWYGLK
jgi:hypothetical protein